MGLMSTKAALEQAQSTIQQWTDYSNGLNEAKSALETEIDILKQQLSGAANASALDAKADAILAAYAASSVQLDTYKANYQQCNEEISTLKRLSHVQQKRVEKAEAEVETLNQKLAELKDQAKEAQNGHTTSTPNERPDIHLKVQEHKAKILAQTARLTEITMLASQLQGCAPSFSS